MKKSQTEHLFLVVYFFFHFNPQWSSSQIYTNKSWKEKSNRKEYKKEDLKKEKIKTFGSLHVLPCCISILVLIVHYIWACIHELLYGDWSVIDKEIYVALEWKRERASKSVENDSFTPPQETIRDYSIPTYTHSKGNGSFSIEPCECVCNTIYDDYGWNVFDDQLFRYISFFLVSLSLFNRFQLKKYIHNLVHNTHIRYTPDI